MKQYAYTGDLKLLKTIGYKFQKLYARNYKSYSKNRMIMYVISKMVLEFSDVRSIGQVAFIEFILMNKDKPKEFWVEDIDYGGKYGFFKDFPIWFITKKGNIVNKEKHDDEKHKIYQETSILLSKKDNGEITEEELKKTIKSWYDTKEFMLDCHMFDFEEIEQVIELNNLHPLELI